MDQPPQEHPIMKKYWKLSDRNQKATVSSHHKVKDLHNWGKNNNLVEESPTLKALVDAGLNKLPDGNDYTKVFEKIMLELELEHTVVEMARNEKSKKENPGSRFVVIKVSSVPVWAFQGIGPNLDAAIEEASKKGVKFFITVSGDNVIF